jgi:putative ABC transport system substrate-binding protein
MLNRRTAVLVGSSLLVAPFAGLAQQALGDLGYVDGKNLTIAGRWAEANGERLPGSAAELVGLGPDLLITIGGPAAEAAKKATSTIPIVFVAPGDAAETGMVTNLARPGGNITGISDPATELRNVATSRNLRRQNPQRGKTR